MDRTVPVAYSDEIELYIRTYYSLLRSSGPVRIRSLEETHGGMNSSLHQNADSPHVDMSALVYSALRLPPCMPYTRMMIMGQMEDVFHRDGYFIETWTPVHARARRRKLYFDPEQALLAAFIASVSDIDDLIPCAVTFQIEWNKFHNKLSTGDLHQILVDFQHESEIRSPEMLDRVRRALDLSESDFSRLGQIWPGPLLFENLQLAARKRFDLQVLVLGSGLSDYRRSVQGWWRAVEEQTLDEGLGTRPVYFVSSNVHSLVNLVSGQTAHHQDELVEYIHAENPEDLREELDQIEDGDRGALANLLYYVARLYGEDQPEMLKRFAEREAEVGIRRVTDPHCLDVEAQVISLRNLQPDWVDPRLQIFDQSDWELLAQSDAIILNIDYPLGMAAYHIFSQITTAVGRMLGVYIIGKAATLNGRVGDVMIPNVVYDEHSRNSYLFRNCFTAQDVSPFLAYGAVFDNQKAVTVRGTILQNREFMHVFYDEGYTDIEMEAGPYLSGIYEDIYPKRYPIDEIVNLFINTPYDIGLIHYASDTPISRRQTLLSKSLSYFGMDATYAASVAVMRRILSQELERLRSTDDRLERLAQL